MRMLVKTTVLLCVAHCVHAQSPQQKEQELLQQFQKLQYHAAPYKGIDHDNDGRDSVKKANTIFRNNLMTYVSGNPASMNYKFSELVKLGLKVETSDDGLFRIYSWDTWLGRTGHDYEAIYQIKTGNQVTARLMYKEDGDGGRWYSRIFQLRTAEDKTYYIAVYSEAVSNADLYQGAKVFCIQENRLNDTARIIKTDNGLRNKIGLSYNANSVAVSGGSEKQERFITFDESASKLFVRIVENGKISKRVNTYQFTGEYFEKVIE